MEIETKNVNIGDAITKKYNKKLHDFYIMLKLCRCTILSKRYFY